MKRKWIAWWSALMAGIIVTAAQAETVVIAPGASPRVEYGRSG